MRKKILLLTLATLNTIYAYADQESMPTPISTFDRVYMGTTGTVKLAAATAITGTACYAGYSLLSAGYAFAGWLNSPIGTTTCVSYVAEVNGTAAAAPLIYGLAEQSSIAATQAIIAAGTTFALNHAAPLISLIGGSAALINYANNSILPSIYNAGYFTKSLFTDGYSDLQTAFS